MHIHPNLCLSPVSSSIVFKDMTLNFLGRIRGRVVRSVYVEDSYSNLSVSFAEAMLSAGHSSNNEAGFVVFSN